MWFFRNWRGLDEEALTIDVAVPREFSGVKSEYDIHSSTITGKSNLAERTGTAGKKLTVITTTGSINVHFE